MRRFINRYGVIVISVCLVVAVLVYFLYGRGGSNRKLGNPSLAYYVNDVTGEESVQSADAIPPLMDKDGNPDLVMEIKISCDHGKDPRVAYLRKYAPEAQARINEILAHNDRSKNEELQRLEAEGELIRLPQPGSPWVKAIGEDGDKVREAVQKMCKPGQAAVPVCPP